MKDFVFGTGGGLKPQLDLFAPFCLAGEWCVRSVCTSLGAEGQARRAGQLYVGSRSVLLDGGPSIV